MLSFDVDGNVVASGSVWSAKTCGDGFVAALDATSGTPVWSKTLDGSFSTTNCYADRCPVESCGKGGVVDNDSVDGLAIDREGRITILADLTLGMSTLAPGYLFQYHVPPRSSAASKMRMR